MTAGNVGRIYDAVRDMAAGFALMPGERINEGSLAASLNVSRTPLREALNRLVAEGFLTFTTGQGFFCRSLTPEEIFDLYEARVAIESATARLAAERAQPDDLAALASFLKETGPDDGGRSAPELVALDEQFHMRLAALSGNAELSRLLDNINGRIRFVRWIDMEERRTSTQGEHAAVLAAVTDRDADRASALMERHIARRREGIVAAVREGYARLFVPPTKTEAGR